MQSAVMLLGILFAFLTQVDMLPVKVSTKRKYYADNEFLDLLCFAAKIC